MNKRKETVTKVIDGDTFETASRKHPVRLSGIDAPEKREPGYREAKRALTDRIEGKKVYVNTVARDIYRRPVAEVATEDGRSVNKAMKREIKK